MGWGGSCKCGVGWVMQGGVGHAGVEWGRSYRGWWVIQGLVGHRGGVGCAM